MDERIRQLIDITGIDELVKRTPIGTNRWRTVRYDKRTRISTKEAEALISIYPQYGLWISTGQVAPEAGQTSPEYDEANKNLKEQGQG